MKKDKNKFRNALRRARRAGEKDEEAIEASELMCVVQGNACDWAEKNGKGLTEERRQRLADEYLIGAEMYL